MQAINAALIDTHRRLRRRQPQRAGEREPGRVAGARRRATSGRRRSPSTCCRSTRAYHEIWLDGEKVAGSAEEASRSTARPTCRASSRPRSPCRRSTTSTCSRTTSASSRSSRTASCSGFNLTVGGGLGATHGEPQTYPRLADVVGFLRPSSCSRWPRRCVTTQRDFGDRTDRKHARLKYTIDDRGLDWFVGGDHAAAGLRARAGAAVRVHDERRPLRLDRGRRRPLAPDAAHRGGPRRRHGDRGPQLTGLREIAQRAPRRLPAHAEPEPDRSPTSSRRRRAFIDALVVRYGLDAHARATPVRRDALACVALPTCALAMAEAERYLPRLRAAGRRAARGARACAASRSRCASPAARTAARGRTSPRSRWSARRPAATTCTSAATAAVSA